MTGNAPIFLSRRFQTELGYDILEIHDGPNLLSTLVGSFNGTQVPQFLFSSSNFLYLLFITDNSRSNVGFKILYESKSENESADIVNEKCYSIIDQMSSCMSTLWMWLHLISSSKVIRWPRELLHNLRLYMKVQTSFVYKPTYFCCFSTRVTYTVCHTWLCLSTSGVTVDSYSCLDPGIPVNGIRYGQDFSIGSTVSFGCDSGYRLSHEEPLVCEKNHWWSHPLPTCDGESERDENCGFKVTFITIPNYYVSKTGK